MGPAIAISDLLTGLDRATLLTSGAIPFDPQFVDSAGGIAKAARMTNDESDVLACA
jgi:hypothetical protein